MSRLDRVGRWSPDVPSISRLTQMAAVAVTVGLAILIAPLAVGPPWAPLFEQSRSTGLIVLGLGVLLFGGARASWQRVTAQRDRFRKTGFSPDELRTLSPDQFEEWCADRLREQGYVVARVGGQADHGVDLVAERDGLRMVVQCKRWFGVRQVGEPQIRDLFGAMQHDHASSAMVLTTGQFSDPARAWALDKPITLWNAEQLVQASPAAAVRPTVLTAPPPEKCPASGHDLVRRVNRRTQDAFWGCSGYPSCRYTRPA